MLAAIFAALMLFVAPQPTSVEAQPGEKEGWVTIVDGERQASLQGRMGTLLKLPESGTVVGIHYRPLKRLGDDVYLLVWGPTDAKPRRLLRLPPTARDLAYWPQKESLLLACDNEIRTILLPGFRSGALYSIPGPNLSVTPLRRPNWIAVGRSDRVQLFDLSRPSGRDAMEPLAETATNAPVVGLERGTTGDTVQALLEDGQQIDLTFELPVVIAKVEPPRNRPQPQAVIEPADKSKIEPPSPPPAKQSETQPQPENEPEVKPEPEPEPKREAVEVKPAPKPTTPPQGYDGAQLHGRVEGNFEGELEVVLAGPNNIIREAARVRLADGYWSANQLAPGRYRVQLEARGNRVVVTEPRFVMVKIDEGARLDEIVFRIVRSF